MRDPLRYIVAPDGKVRPTPEYSVWAGMLRRCRNPHEKKYPFYGGRGIKVCESWLKFENFRQDMGARPHPKAELDRIDTNGHYELSNCRWVNHQENTNNTRRNVWLEWNGRRQTVSQWAQELDIDVKILQDRLKDGWDVERTLSEPPKGHVFLEYQGRRQTLADWSRETGIPRRLLSWRVRRGWPPERVLAPPESTPLHTLRWNGQTRSYTEWEQETGIDREVIRTRCEQLGWDAERTLTTPVRPPLTPPKARAPRGRASHLPE